MKDKDFFDAIENDPQLEGVGYDQEKIYIRDSTDETLMSLSWGTIEGNSWPTIRGVLTKSLNPDVLIHTSRVVGYFSRIDNWNKSKIGELKDRHKGSYGLPEGQTKGL